MHSPVHEELPEPVEGVLDVHLHEPLPPVMLPASHEHVGQRRLVAYVPGATVLWGGRRRAGSWGGKLESKGEKKMLDREMEHGGSTYLSALQLLLHVHRYAEQSGRDTEGGTQNVPAVGNKGEDRRIPGH